MKVQIEVPDYNDALHMEWEPDVRIETKQMGSGALWIGANRDGLISLARLLLTLADERVPDGHHWHLDDSNSLEDGSVELIVEKVEERWNVNHQKPT